MEHNQGRLTTPDAIVNSLVTVAAFEVNIDMRPLRAPMLEVELRCQGTPIKSLRRNAILLTCPESSQWLIFVLFTKVVACLALA